MMKAYIVDDEIKALELLRTYIDRIEYIELVGASRDPVEAFHYLKEHQIDILFLDINMPVLSGVDLYKSLSDPPAVIFTTAYAEYAVEGFNLQAVDYLVKPITFPRFLQASERLSKKQTNEYSPKGNLENDFANIIYVKSGAVTHKLSWKEIQYIEKDENYVIYHTEAKKILSRQTLTDIEAIFPSYFCRIHKSYAVSLLHLSQLEREFVKLADKLLPVGRTYKGKLKEKLEGFKGLT